MEDLYRLFPSADTQEGEGGESKRERGRWRRRKKMLDGLQKEGDKSAER